MGRDYRLQKRKSPGIEPGLDRNRCGRCELLGHHTHVRALIDAATAELHLARDLREQRVVGAATNVLASVILRAALTHDDVAGDDLLATGLLEPEPFGL